MSSALALANLFSVEDKRVIVTGGATGIGRMIATTFAVNGAKVYITGRRGDVLDKTAREVNAEVEENGGKGCVIAQVVVIWRSGETSKALVAEFHAKIAEKEEKIDTLVNCAGVLIPFRSKAKDHNDVQDVQQLLESVEDEDFAIQNSVNVAGPYFMTTAFAPMLMKSDNPNVINIASIGAYALQKKVGSLTYSVSKGATITLSSQLASRLIPYGIRVNCICPGRAGETAEIGGPCVMLASAAGAYTNNATIVVDGGRLMTLSSNA
ncbi:hypothetical protein NliqN6_6005 [Naganishia liquefaciens]|uniref:SDR family oxidoreductase n=1 Tax=Naganishia liquefaciens TaxID=104408 RepID=A0A8H3YHR0_9TREE|nr:hypothetical protein NliqN6_6005 [Naganishia liquefaciens]